MKLSYVVWRDASHGLEEIGRDGGDLAELHEVGFIWREDDEKITLTLEYQEGAETARNWLSIPKQNIVSRHDRDLSKCFPKPRNKKNNNVT